MPIKATDDVQVTLVSLVIADENGTVLEQVNALPALRSSGRLQSASGEEL
jgi:hypothetical protein